jgi:hypothetical protein
MFFRISHLLPLGSKITNVFPTSQEENVSPSPEEWSLHFTGVSEASSPLHLPGDVTCQPTNQLTVTLGWKEGRR